MSKAERTRQFIIEKTAPVFNRKGYAGTSLNDMTTATGLTKGSIYGNFGNKDEVAIEAFHFNHKSISANFLNAISQKNTYKEKLLVYPTLYEDLFIKVIAFGGCPILNTATEADDTHPVLKEHANTAIENWKKNIVLLIEKGIEAGEFKAKDINPEQTALTIVASIEGAIMITKLSGKSNYFKAIMLSVRKMIEDLT